MSKKHLLNLKRYLLLSIIGWLSFSDFAHADVAGTLANIAVGATYGDLLANTFAWISSFVMSIMVVWITITGALLNVSITLTLHIKDFVDSTEGVYIVWQTIRDVSGMFIIFMLLYASFRLILSRGDAGSSVGNLIKNVVIVGVLINFSFFITSLLIDASNIVSLALYDAIVTPTTQNTGVNVSNITTEMISGSKGGLSDILLNYLKPQIIQNAPSAASPNASSGAKPVQIIIQGVVGVIIMFTIGLSFLLASLAFIVRLIVLILLLAFSPIWFAAWIIPELDSKAKEFTKQLKAQLIFMPVYLLLLYAALRVLSASSVFTNPSAVQYGTGSIVPLNYVVLAINDFFIIFLLNIPLVVAFGMGGVASEWIDTKKWGAAGIWKGVGGFAGTRTAGRVASRLDKDLGNTKIGNTLLGRDIRSATIGAVAKSKFGGSRNVEELDKAKLEKVRKGNEIDRRNAFNSTFGSIKSGSASRIVLENGHDLLKDMGEKEKVALIRDNLKDEKALEILAKSMKKSDFESISKSDDFSPEEKKSVSDARANALVSSAAAGHDKVVKYMVGNMSDDDKRIMSTNRDAALTAAVALPRVAGTPNKTVEAIVNSMSGKDLMNSPAVTNPEVIAFLKPSQLIEMEENGINIPTKKAIGRAILNWDTDPRYAAVSSGNTHKAFNSFLDDPSKDHWWS